MLNNKCLTVDGSKAGSGNLEILVNGGHVTSFVRTLGSQRFLASFVPHEALTHLVEMTFNGEVVPGEKGLLFFRCSDSALIHGHGHA